MHFRTRFLFLAPFMLAIVTGQLNLEVKIEGNNNTNVNTQTLSDQLVVNNLGQVQIITDSSSVLIVDKCAKGTFSKDGTACINCPAGTASPVEGASNPMTCSACVTGAFSGTASSVCTDCPINTFSTAYMASSVVQCLVCPPHATSPTQSNQVQDCVCDSGYFMSDNILTPFDSILAPLGFEGAASINIPHVIC